MVRHRVPCPAILEAARGRSGMWSGHRHGVLRILDSLDSVEKQKKIDYLIDIQSAVIGEAGDQEHKVKECWECGRRDRQRSGHAASGVCSWEQLGASEAQCVAATLYMCDWRSVMGVCRRDQRDKSKGRGASGGWRASAGPPWETCGSSVELGRVSWYCLGSSASEALILEESWMVKGFASAD